jgi:hypothetical protein
MSNSPATSTSRYPLRKRVISGGVIVGVLAFAWWWSGLNRGLGPGADNADDDRSSQPTSSADSDSEDADQNGDDGPIAVDGDRLTVLISGSSYLIVEETGRTPATLEEIVELARQMPGDDDGIRVQIEHDATGTSGAQTDLEQALRDAGLTPDELRVMQQSVP